ncbi:MAG TPA: ATP-dependent DNA ligase, partial [Polyangiaceae bacterium]
MPASDWKRFAEASESLLASRGKLDKKTKIASFLREMNAVDPKAASLAALYFSGTPFTEGDPRVLNVGWRLLSTVVAAVSLADPEAMMATYREHGDMGAGAADLLAERSRVGAPLSLEVIANAFDALAATNVQAQKLAILRDLVDRADAPDGKNLEAKYLVKLISGDMRTGVKATLVEEAIAEAANVPLDQVRRAITLTGDVPLVTTMAFAGTLSAAEMKLFHPLGFMLASPADGVDDAAERFVQDEGKIDAQIEDKYDGIRAQLHFGDAKAPGKVALFSRTRGEITKAFPEIAELVEKADIPAILDGEILAWDFATDRAQPFSSLQTRLGRKKVTAEMRTSTPVVFMAFDVLYAKGELVLGRTLAERRAILEAIVGAERAAAKAGKRSVVPRGQMDLFGSAGTPQIPLDRIRLAPAFRVETATELDRAYAAARERGNEGVMLKRLDSVYEPGRRGHAWMKLKRELATLDVVVTAAEYGHGKRAKVLSDYTFAVRDGDRLVNVGKAYSGLTDVEIAELTQWFFEHTIE